MAPPGTRHSATCLAPRPVTVIVGDPAAWGSQRQLSWGPKRPGAFFSREPRQDSWGQAPAERSRERPGARVGATSAAGVGGGCAYLMQMEHGLGPPGQGHRQQAEQQQRTPGARHGAPSLSMPQMALPVPHGTCVGTRFLPPFPVFLLQNRFFTVTDIFWSSFRATEIAQKVQGVPIQPPPPFP